MIEEALNIANGLASIAALISFSVAVCTWKRNRDRLMDGMLNVGRIAERSPRTAIRFQNVGGTGVLIQSIWFRCESYSAGNVNDPNMPRNVLMPGELFNEYVTGDAEDVVVIYATHNDVTVRHIDRFQLDGTSALPSRIRQYTKPTRKMRKAMKYRCGELFQNTTDCAPQRRTIPATMQPKDGDPLDYAINWLDTNGYHAIRGGIG